MVKVRSRLAVEFACHTAACRPPGSGGTGGSTGGSSRPIPPPPGRRNRAAVPGYGPEALPDISLRGVKVTYHPKYPDDHPNPGEVVWARVPFQEDRGQSKDRPVLVIGRIEGTDKLAAVQLTTKGRGRSNEMDIGAGAWDSQHRNSSVKLDRIIQIDANNYRREGSVMPRKQFDNIIGHVAAYNRMPVTIAASAARSYWFALKK